jgi:hypothetical protein
MSALKDSLSKPLESKSNQALDDLRKQAADLEKKQKDE